jgi:hypothetical protein
MAWSDLQPLATPEANSRIDFNQVFADFVSRGEFNSSFHNQLRNIGWNRLLKLEPIRLPGCEPVASPFADPILGHIVGRCDA